jgi:hypothetical protein
MMKTLITIDDSPLIFVIIQTQKKVVIYVINFLWVSNLTIRDS